jgi:hypothetical protein
MRRAVVAVLLVAALPLTALAFKPEGPVDAVGMLAYRHAPRFKVGDWVRYRTRGESHQGFRTDYTVTVLIAGEELWWGEECFWVETQTSYSGQAPELTASLVSYAIFGDTMPSRRFGRYLRKFIEGMDDQGNFLQQPFRRAPSEISSRTFAEFEAPRAVDTLGMERIEVPKGVFDALRERRVLRATETAQQGDSTVYYELVEEQSYWWSDAIPLTRLVRLDQETIQRRRVWMIGESENAPLQVAERSSGGTQLLDFGSGMKSLTIPERFQRPLSEQRPARPPAARKPPQKRG